MAVELWDRIVGSEVDAVDSEAVADDADVDGADEHGDDEGVLGEASDAGEVAVQLAAVLLDFGVEGFDGDAESVLVFVGLGAKAGELRLAVAFVVEGGSTEALLAPGAERILAPLVLATEVLAVDLPGPSRSSVSAASVFEGFVMAPNVARAGINRWPRASGYRITTQVAQGRDSQAQVVEVEEDHETLVGRCLISPEGQIVVALEDSLDWSEDEAESALQTIVSAVEPEQLRATIAGVLRQAAATAIAGVSTDK